MARPVYYAYTDALAQAQGLAQQVAALLRHAVAAQGSAVLAVSGGRSPVAFFEALAALDLPWEHVEVRLADERLLPPEHSDSNAGLVRRHLLQGKAAAAHWCGLVAEDAGPKLHTPEGRAACLQGALHAYRRPDVLILGMGEDGHTASLFADAPQLEEALSLTTPTLVLTSPQSAPYERIGMSLNAIAAATHVIMAIQGASKWQVLREALASGAPNPCFPVSCVVYHPQIYPQIYYTVS